MSSTDSKIALLAQVPDDIILDIFKHTESKMCMNIIFPWLPKFKQLCEFCKHHDACFIINFNYCMLHYIDIRRSRFYDHCDDCQNYTNDLKHTYDKFKYICRLNCNSLKYSLHNYNIAKNYNMFADYDINDECDECDSIRSYKIRAFGKQMRSLPTSEEMILKFIKDKLIANKDQKILKYIIIAEYKRYNQDVEKEKDIKSMFDKLIKNDKTHYLGYKFINNITSEFYVIFDYESDDFDSCNSDIDSPYNQYQLDLNNKLNIKN